MSVHRRKFLTTLGIGLSGSALASPVFIDGKDGLKTEFVFKAEVLVDKIMDLGRISSWPTRSDATACKR